MNFTIPALTFRQMLTGCLVGAGKDTNLAKINAIQMEVDSGQVFFASTDRYRLTIADTQAFRPGAEDGVILMSRSDAEAVVKMMPAKPAPEDTIRVKSADADTFAISLGAPMDIPKWAVKFVRITEEFPKWRRLIPTESRPVLSVKYNTAYLADLNKIPRDKTKPVEWTFFGDGKPALAMWEHDAVNWKYLLMPVRT